MPKFYIFTRIINKVPEFYQTFARKMPEFYIMFAGKIFPFLFFFGGGGSSPSPTPMAELQASHQLNPAPITADLHRIVSAVERIVTGSLIRA